MNALEVHVDEIAENRDDERHDDGYLVTTDTVGPKAEERRGEQLSDAERRHDPAEERRVLGDLDDLQERPHRAHGDGERHGREEHDHVADFDREETILQVLFGLLRRYRVLEAFAGVKITF